MGYTGIFSRARTPEQFFKAELQHKQFYGVVDYAVRGNVIYVADRLPDGMTLARVVHVEKCGAEWRYKIVSENEGPFETRCPVRILRSLSETQNKWALRWRAECLANMGDIQ